MDHRDGTRDGPLTRGAGTRQSGPCARTRTRARSRRAGSQTCKRASPINRKMGGCAVLREAAGRREAGRRSRSVRRLGRPRAQTAASLWSQRFDAADGDAGATLRWARDRLVQGLPLVRPIFSRFRFLFCFFCLLSRESVYVVCASHPWHLHARDFVRRRRCSRGYL